MPSQSFRQSFVIKSRLALWTAMAGLTLLASGCTQPDKDKADQDQVTPPGTSGETAKGEASGSLKPAPNSSNETKTEAAVRKLVTSKLVSEEALKIKPSGGAPGYKAASKAMSLRSLGSKVDEAITKLPPSMVDGRISYSTGEGELMGKVNIKVQNSSTFKVQYNMPKLKAEAGSVMGDGKRIAQKSEAGWKLKTKEGGMASSSEIEQWPMEFTEMMFKPLTDSRSVWGPLFESWQKKGAKVEEKPQTVNGKRKVLYRVILVQKDSQMEVILDGDRMLPLTVRSDVPRKGGGRDRMMWTGQWMFGGSHQAKDFLIPIK